MFFLSRKSWWVSWHFEFIFTYTYYNSSLISIKCLSDMFLFLSFKILFSFLSLFFLNWSMIALQCYVSYCCTRAWISYMYIYISPPSWASLLPHHPNPLGRHRALSWASVLYSSFQYLSVIHMVCIYVSATLSIDMLMFLKISLSWSFLTCKNLGKLPSEPDSQPCIFLWLPLPPSS